MPSDTYLRDSPETGDARIAQVQPSRPVNAHMAGAMLLIGTLNILLAERVTASGGLGWDGRLYGAIARDFFHRVFVVRLPEYNLQRILPPGIVHYAMRLFGIERTNANIIYAFDVLNLLLLVLSAYVWGLIADRLSISVRGKWLGFLFLFANYAILKNNFYHSVLTDTTAFALGMLMLYFYLAGSTPGLLGVMVAGYFTWPTVAPFAGLLMAFPYARAAVSLNGTPRWRRLPVLFAALVAIGSAGALLYLTGPRLAEVRAIYGRALRLDMPLLYVSIAATSLFLFFALKTAADDPSLFDVRRAWAQFSVRGAAIAFAMMVALKLVARQLANGEPGWANLKLFTVYTLLSSATEPLLFVVAHVVYFGPAIILMLLLWRPMNEAARPFGVGLRILLIGNILLGVNPQSRYHINVVAVFMMLLVLVMDRIELQPRHLAFLTVLSLVWSKIWYVMNRGPVTDDETMEVLLRFPLQHYFMNSGPWMSKPMYFVHLAAVLVSAVLVYLVFAGRIRVHREAASAAR